MYPVERASWQLKGAVRRAGGPTGDGRVGQQVLPRAAPFLLALFGFRDGEELCFAFGKSYRRREKIAGK
ncbi:unnamed protein product [Thelazia callipaeda]|uniref:Uncharacterized protein n=1 Tax=Thelazia callipaeda TaxID=103827 RepID=A0A0N5CVV6_THECL|nr:unnamed protein product [Thelazia callipaeda]